MIDDFYQPQTRRRPKSPTTSAVEDILEENLWSLLLPGTGNAIANSGRVFRSAKPTSLPRAWKKKKEKWLPTRRVHDGCAANKKPEKKPNASST